MKSTTVIDDIYPGSGGLSRSRRKLRAVRENGKQPCKGYQRGRPRAHEVCGQPMKRLDAHHHYCETCRKKVFIEKVYVRPDRQAASA